MMKIGPALPLLGLLSLFSSTAFAAAADDLQIEGAYIRQMPANARATAAFMKLQNTGKQAIKITGAESTIAQRTELHTHLMQDGMMQMRPVSSIDIPPNGSVLLQPGGLHLMLIQLNGPLEDGGQRTIQLRFADGSQKSVNLPILKIGTPSTTPPAH